jgi:hypothetical protein
MYALAVCVSARVLGLHSSLTTACVRTCASKRKRMEKIEPLYNRYEKPNEWRLSKRKPAHRASQTFG